MSVKETWDENVLANLTEADLELPNLDWVDDEEEIANESIKNEERENEDDDVNNFDDINLDEALIPHLSTRKMKEVLITIDNERKKIITLEDGKDDIEKKFLASLKEDPVFKKSIRNSHIMFQVYNHKFNTWVDLDTSREICDGANLKAIFIPKTKKELHLHRKNKHRAKKSKRKRSAERHSESNSKHRKYKHSKSSYYDDDCGNPNLSKSGNDCDTRDAGSCSSSDKKTVEHCSSSGDGSVQRTMSMTVEHGVQDYSRRSSVTENSTPTSTTKTYSNLPSLLPVSEGELYYLSLGLAKKNPITALHELCQKRKWGVPVFEVVQECLLPIPSYTMKVTVRGQTYVPVTPSAKKKLAKTVAAEFALKKLGILK